MSNIFIDVAATWTGARAFKDAENATDKLNRSVKKLGRNLGLTLSTAAVIGYAKASVSAAANDQRAQQELALALKNVGLQRDAASAEGYVQRLQSEFGVVDDLLRPAYQKLAIATRDTAETQRLLTLSLDISAATGKDLDSVTSALSKAYLGNNVALSKLGIGISKADLKTKSFKTITDQLSVTFAGAATTSAGTFAGSIARLNVATTNAKEIIGTSLIGALTSLSGDKSMSNFAADIENAAKSMANFINSVVYLKGELSTIPGTGLVTGSFDLIKNILGRFSPQRAAELLKQIKGFQGMGNVSMSTGSQDFQKSDAIAKAAAAKAAAAAAKKAADQQSALLKTQQDQLKLSKAKAIFDLQKIQIAAALKGKVSEEDRIRLLLMQAIEDENVKTIDKYTKALAEAQAQTKQLQSVIDASKASFVWPDPFASFKVQAAAAGTTVQALVDKVKTLSGISFDNSTVMTSFAQGILNGMSAVDALWGARYTGQGEMYMARLAAASTTSNADNFSFATAGTGVANPNMNTTTIINLTNDFGSSIVTDPVATANQINTALQQAANQVGTYGSLGGGSKAVTYAV
jgi:hypothetical protein